MCAVCELRAQWRAEERTRFLWSIKVGPPLDLAARFHRAQVSIGSLKMQVPATVHFISMQRRGEEIELRILSWPRKFRFPIKFPSKTGSDENYVNCIIFNQISWWKRFEQGEIAVVRTGSFWFSSSHVWVGAIRLEQWGRRTPKHGTTHGLPFRV